VIQIRKRHGDELCTANGDKERAVGIVRRKVRRIKKQEKLKALQEVGRFVRGRVVGRAQKYFSGTHRQSESALCGGIEAGWCVWLLRKFPFWISPG
jgi:hypothetical protein